MTNEPMAARRARLARATAQAVAQAAAAVQSAGDGGGPRVGELFVLRETAGFAVEWLVVERGEHDGERLYAVPADTNPLLGADDWGITGDAVAGPLSLRCRYGVWLAARRFAPELRGGVLAPAELGPAAAWCVAVRDARGAGARPQAGGAERRDAMAGDPDYEEWVQETVAPACLAAARGSLAPTPAMTAAGAAGAAGAAPVAGALPAPGVLPASGAFPASTAAGAAEAGRDSPARRAAGSVLRAALAAVRGRRRTLIALAAMLPLALALTLAGLLGREARRVERLRGERDLLRGELRQEAAAGPSRGAADAAGGVLRDLPLVALQSETLRGAGARVRLDGAPQRLVLLAIEPLPGAVFPEYRLEIRDLRDGREVWSGGGLHLDPATGVVTLGVRQQLLPPGRYEIRLDGWQAGHASAAGSYSLEVERAAPPAQR